MGLVEWMTDNLDSFIADNLCDPWSSVLPQDWLRREWGWKGKWGPYRHWHNSICPLQPSSLQSCLPHGTADTGVPPHGHRMPVLHGTSPLCQSLILCPSIPPLCRLIPDGGLGSCPQHGWGRGRGKGTWAWAFGVQWPCHKQSIVLYSCSFLKVHMHFSFYFLVCPGTF